MKKEKLSKRVREMHQHMDDRGVVCGKSHPIDAFHRNVRTRICHNKSLISSDKQQYAQV